MKIARLTAHALSPPVPIRAPGIDRTVQRPIVFVQIETDTGIVGHGITSLAPARGTAALIDNTVAPLVLGLDARRIANVWNTIYRELAHRGQTGLAYHAISAIDIALWDIRGKALNEAVWRLLGGARDKVPCYVTCGLPSMDREQLASVAKHWVAQGFGGVKLVVGVIARDRAHEFANMTEALLEDARRVKAVRDAVGHAIEIAIDINCEIDPAQALTLTRMCAPYGVAFVEEPVPDNDAGRMADFRRQAGVQVAAGQSMAGLSRFKELLVRDAVDILQPNVVNCGGYTGGLRAADLALGFATPIGNGGGSTQHNLHLQAGAVNGTVCEWHPYQSAGAVAAICPNAPVPQNGYLTLTDAPGLGFDPDPAALAEYAIKD
ncbi:MAG: mandelate racemase/muconate lactonizing enzyme family protein [Hyphomicrobiales bacterium]|nr:mandelate racemase/muconate lactonizing enzyme family protein [Hyphomicrobiales bacterium]